MDAYDELELDKDSCTQEDIKIAYQRLILIYHPDRCTDTEEEKKEASVARFIRVKEAWQNIGTQSKRTEYDRSLQMSSQVDGPTVRNSDRVTLDEFEKEEVEVEIECDGTSGTSTGADGHNNKQSFHTAFRYTKQCRCGDVYEIDDTDILDGFNTVQCNGCSLYCTIIM